MSSSDAGVTHHSLVTDSGALRRAVERCQRSGVLALDTEFMRVRTFHPQAALFQLFDGEHCELVDPLSVGEISALARLLADTSVTKIMHSCSEDLEVCARHLGVLPEPLTDTQVLAAFCGHGLSIGYQKLVGLELGIELKKSETRTDWLQRPLSPAQLDYAAEDVLYLLRLDESLQTRLAREPSKAAWAAEECASLLPRARARDGTVDLGSIGGAWRLDRPRLAVLRALHVWREQLARARDLPRNWVVPDAALMRIAEIAVTEVGALASVTELPEAARRRHGGALVAEVTAALALDDAAMPALLPAPPGPAETRLVKSLRERVVAVGEASGVAPEMLAKRRDLEDLVRRAVTGHSVDGSVLMSGWRREAIGEMLWSSLGAAL